MSSFEYSSKVPVWNVDLPESPWDVNGDTENLDVLCELVRNQYLKRLRQTLFDNLDVSKGYQKEHLRIEQCVDICVAEMEKEALKRCMMASIYRESMSSMVSFFCYTMLLIFVDFTVFIYIKLKQLYDIHTMIVVKCYRVGA